MGVWDRLLGIGGKLGMIRIISTSAPAPPGKIATRKVSLAELKAQIQAEEVRKLADEPPQVEMDFGRIFQAAGIAPAAHGWTVDKLVEVLKAKTAKRESRDQVQRELIAELSSAGAHVHELVQEAVARDKALDAFEETARARLEQTTAARNSQRAELEAQIQALQQQCRQLEQEEQTRRAELKTWHDRKIACEKELDWATGFLLDRSVITIDHDH